MNSVKNARLTFPSRVSFPKGEEDDLCSGNEFDACKYGFDVFWLRGISQLHVQGLVSKLKPLIDFKVSYIIIVTNAYVQGVWESIGIGDLIGL
jgi:hypothetical protein